MNKNKIIFAIIGVILIILLIIGLIAMNGSNKRKHTTKNASGTFKIWIVGDKKSTFESVLTHFKDENKSFSNVIYEVESFPNYEEYSNALTSAIIKGVAPDMFVLNNNETSLFEEKVLAIPNDVININKFRKNYEGVFIDDLIMKDEKQNEDGEYNEFLKGIPVGYETLGIFYDKTSGFKTKDFASFAQLRKGITRIKRHGLIPIAIGNGSTVSNAGDIIAQLFLLKKVKSLKNSNLSNDKTVLYDYTKFGSIEGINGYNNLFADAINYDKNDIDLFRDKEVGAIVGYPRLVNKLQTLGFSRNLLLVEPFPHFHSSDGPTFINYNYFVINNETSQEDTAFALMKYLNSDKGAETYLKKFKYYIPAKRNLAEDFAEKKVSNFFNSIILQNFYSEDHELSSFNKGNKVLFDKGIIHILDDFSSYTTGFEKFKKSLLCKTNKILNLENLSISCD